MFQRILVPLDGSRLAESVLPVAEYLAKCAGATLILFHAIERGAAETVHGERHLAHADEAQAYLSEVAARLRKAGLTVEQHVHDPEEADVARSIVDHATDLQSDLILLCAHGRGGLRDVLIGNIAQQVIQDGPTLVFFVRPDAMTARVGGYRCRKILVPLDISSPHETGLPVAVQLARQCGAAVHVMTVVPTMSTLPADEAPVAVMLPTASAAVLDLDARNARQYLEEVTRDLVVQGLAADGSVARGDVASLILSTAKGQQVDLIVLATHARRMLGARWEGSVAPKVLAQAADPVLLVRED